MVALKSAEVDAFVARPTRPVVLVFGPDLGLVRERAEAIIRASVDDPRDPFGLVRLDGDELAGDPMRLVDEAQTVPLFGGRRAVHLRVGARNIMAGVEALLAIEISDCRVVIEAGDLKRNAPLRVACERAKSAAVVACYADSERDLGRLVDEEMRAADLSIAADARAALVPLLGSDRRASLMEIRKLVLYAHGERTVELDDVLAVVADASSLALDRVVDLAFAGRHGEVEAELGKTRTAGTAPGSIVMAAVRQVAQLHKARLAIEGGASLEQVMSEARPPVHFTRRTLVEAALKSWSSARLERSMAQLAAAALEARRQPAVADAIAHRALMSIAGAARRK
ncbi:MAG: DNA polymerase III subunit delta [Xanthobacteraceae bacterium]